MNWLSTGYSALVGDAAQQQSGAETVDKLCDRIANSSMLEDRRAAVLGLKALSREYQLEVGTKGMPILLHILKQDNRDTDTTKAILETLCNLCATHKTSHQHAQDDNGHAHEDSNLGAQFTEILVKDGGNVTLLLEVLAQTDFHVRYNTIELLKLLLRNKRKELQDAILTARMGVSRLMDLLDDQREVVRNEGLLLLIDLTQQNADIQKIIAFESAFERLLQIIYEEDAADGDVIVEDCLQLIQNLLRDNVSNQTYFKESGLIPKLAGLFEDEPDNDDANDYKSGMFFTMRKSDAPWPGQKMRNVTIGLSIVQLLVGAGNPNANANQMLVFGSRLFHSLLQLGLARNVPTLIRAGAFYTIAYSLQGNQTLQDALGSFVLADPNIDSMLTPIIVELISIILTATTFEKPDFLLRAACAFLTQCYLKGNSDTQNFLVTTLNSPSTETSNDHESTGSHSAGSLLLAGLLDWDESRKDPFRSWFSAVILSNIVSENKKCKQRALQITIPDHEDQDSQLDFLTSCTHAMMISARESADLRVQIGFMCFTATFLYEFPEGVKLFLGDTANFSFLIEQISQSSAVDPVMQGLAAFILGICFEYNNDDAPGLTRSEIQSIVTSRIGADQFTARLTRLKDSRAFSRSSLEGDFDVVDTKSGFPDVYFDESFVAFFKNSYETIQRSMVNPHTLKQKAAKKEEAAREEGVIGSYKSLISKQDKEIHDLTAQVASLKSQLSGKSKSPEQIPLPLSPVVAEQPSQLIESEIIAPYQDTIKTLEAQVSEWKQKQQDTQKEMDDLLVCLAEQDIEAQRLRDRLKALGEEVEFSDEDADE